MSGNGSNNLQPPAIGAGTVSLSPSDKWVLFKVPLGSTSLEIYGGDNMEVWEIVKILLAGALTFIDRRKPTTEPPRILVPKGMVK